MACLFSRCYEVVGFDLSARRIDELNRGYDHGGDVPSSEIRDMLDRGGVLTTDLEALRTCNFYVVVVPTPVDEKCRPNVSFIREASREVGSVLTKGDVVVFESTVYPGATEEICVPALEEASGLVFNEDFYVGYSPERINPGDRAHMLANVVKVTSGSTPEAAKFIDSVYASVLGEGNTWLASSLRVAEATKVIENTQRDVNIAFMNEIAQILDAMDIDTTEVIEAMNTKWNALGFRPGLVGGHCIGVDPYYLIECAAAKGLAANLMMTARSINNSMPAFVTGKVIQLMKDSGIEPRQARVLLLGFTFKENCPDVRNTKVYEICRMMRAYTDNLTVYDPWANKERVRQMYGVEICTEEAEFEGETFDVIVLCVAHELFREFDLEAHRAPNSILYDVKGFFPSDAYRDGWAKR